MGTVEEEGSHEQEAISYKNEICFRWWGSPLLAVTKLIHQGGV